MTQDQEYNRSYYQKNKERIKARSAAWAKANPERVSAYKRKWDGEHKDLLREYWRAASKRKRENWTQADRDAYNERRRVSRKRYALDELDASRRFKASLRSFIKGEATMEGSGR